jgi:hypothetical protein
MMSLILGEISFGIFMTSLTKSKKVENARESCEFTNLIYAPPSIKIFALKYWSHYEN